MGSLCTKEGILIVYNEYDLQEAQARGVDALLSLYDVERGGMADIPSTKCPKEKLVELFSELEQLCKDKNLTLETAKPIFQKYGL